MLAKLKKRKRLAIILTAIVIALVAVIFVFRNIAGGRMAAAAAESSIASATATTGNISSTVVGTGNLANDEAVDITIPSEIVIEDILVSSGDFVNDGDVLATVDPASVLSKMTSVQSEIESLDEQIEDAKDDTESTTVTAGVSGRIKKIYAAAEDSVSAVMVENGALAVISTDGLMAVSFETESSVAAGSEVDVTLSDGTTITGTVERVSGGTAVVTMTDNGPALGDSVTVRDSSGNTLGTGELYVHQPLSVTATSGTVKTVHVSENQSVSSGKTLLTLKDTSATAEYKQLVAQRAALSETLQALLALAENNTLTATQAGTIESVNLTEGGTTSSSSANADSSADAAGVSASAGAETGGYTLLAAVSETAADITILEGEAGTAIESLSGLAVQTPITGEKPQSSIATQTSYFGEITWNPSAGTFAAETVYMAKLVLTARGGYYFSNTIGAEALKTSLGASAVSNLTFGGDSSTLEFTLTFPATEKAVTATDDPAVSNGSSSGSSSVTTDSAASILTGTAASSTSSTDTSSVADSTDSVNTDAVTAFTISSNENMLVTITVDELDILSLEEGQSAAVTLDAIESEIFEGTISSINTTASSSGGVTSYTADITIAKTDSMLAGMSASATITISEVADVLMLPAEAVQEVGGSIFVYTEQDSDGNLGGETEVETGVSNGTFVEITSGINEGDVVYYTVVATESSTEDIMFGGGGGMVVTEGSGEMPSGGEAPTGGGQFSGEGG